MSLMRKPSSMLTDETMKNSSNKILLQIKSHPHLISLRFRKAGRVWCGGARETH